LPGIFYQELTANYPSIGTLKLQSNGSLYSSTQAVDGCNISYSEEGPGQAAQPFLAVPNATARPSTASARNSYYSL